VSEEQIERAVYTTMKQCHIVIEPSAAAAVAALLDKLRPKPSTKVAIVISGGNVSLKLLQNILAKYG
jgi:threonine dehydratase